MTHDPFKQCIEEIVTFCKQVDDMVKAEELGGARIICGVIVRYKALKNPVQALSPTKQWQAFLVKKLIEKLGEREQWYYLPDFTWAEFRWN